MSLKLKFVEQACAPGANIAALCREYAISRQTGHKWLRRYHEEGPLGLVEQSRRPRSSPLTKAEDIVAAIVELRNRRPSWGPDKIARVIAARFGSEAPSRSTVARVLRRLGKVKRRRPVARFWAVNGREHVDVRAPNELWTIDFKGWWKAGNGQRCEPLTVRDAYSRYVLAATLVGSTRGTVVKHVLQRLFREHGVPGAIQCDNGCPWVSTQSRGGLTRLSAWLMSLGIRLVRSRPGCPQDNGGHERMHRDLGELQLRPARSRAAQQLEVDRWLVDFNHVRPHAALGGKTTAAGLQVSTLRRGQTKVQLSARERGQMCQRSIDMHPASQATEVVRKVVRKVIIKVVRRLIRKVITTCTSLRTTLRMRRLTSL